MSDGDHKRLVRISKRELKGAFRAIPSSGWGRGNLKKRIESILFERCPLEVTKVTNLKKRIESTFFLKQYYESCHLESQKEN